MIRKDIVIERLEGTKIYRQRVCIGKRIDDENMNPKKSGMTEKALNYLYRNGMKSNQNIAAFISAMTAQIKV